MEQQLVVRNWESQRDPETSDHTDPGNDEM